MKRRFAARSRPVFRTTEQLYCELRTLVGPRAIGFWFASTDSNDSISGDKAAVPAAVFRQKRFRRQRARRRIRSC